MSTVRPRIPFRFTEDDQIEGHNNVLDEQEQDEVITRLRAESALSNQRYLYAFLGLIAASSFSQLVYLLIYAIRGLNERSALRYTPQHSLLSLFLHSYFIFLAQARLRTHLPHLKSFTPPAQLLSFPNRYGFHVLALVSPVCSWALGKPREIVLWWSFAAIIGFAIETVGNTVDDELESIDKLEGKRYIAPGA